MAIIQCDYYDKKLDGTKGLGDLNVNYCHFAHALLSLYGTYESARSACLEYFASLLTTLARFRFPIPGKLSYKLRPKDVYDGVLRAESDLFASAIAILVAKKKYKHKHVFNLFEKQIRFKNPKKKQRPDFLATNGTDYSLFESKGSLANGRKVSDKRVNDGIDQLNSVSAVVLDGKKWITSFKEKVVVATRLKKNRKGLYEVKCRIYDPDNLEGNAIDFNISEALNDYYSFVRELIKRSEGRERHVKMVGDHRVIVSPVIRIEDRTVEIGLLDKLYDNEFEDYKDVYKILEDVGNYNSGLYSDGVYLRIVYDRPFFPENH